MFVQDRNVRNLQQSGLRKGLRSEKRDPLGRVVETATAPDGQGLGPAHRIVWRKRI